MHLANDKIEFFIHICLIPRDMLLIASHMLSLFHKFFILGLKVWLSISITVLLITEKKLKIWEIQQVISTLSQYFCREIFLYRWEIGNSFPFFSPLLVRAMSRAIQGSGINLNNQVLNFQVLILLILMILCYLMKLWEIK